MLSFLREGGIEKTVSTAPSSDKGLSAPEAGKDPEKQEYPAVKIKKQAFKGTLLLAFLFVIVLLCLLFMVKQNVPKTAAAATSGAEEARIDKAIARLTSFNAEKGNGPERIVKEFYELSNVEQVSVSKLIKNPFKTERILSNADLQSLQLANISPDKLHLLSIMQSNQKICCMINDRILYTGDSIGGYKVRQIADNFVRLESGDARIILKLSE
ncbi:MAG: hypothetical protein ACYSYU_02145 [Planctomycetota bacterium]|jgi:hypothetical protein